MTEQWYRFEDRQVSRGVDQFDNDLGSYTEVYLLRPRVIKYTPKGVWLDLYGTKRLVLHASRKRYACATVAEALDSFNARKKRQIGIYTARIQHAKEAMDRAFVRARIEEAKSGQKESFRLTNKF